ncbi:MAG: HIT family protein [Bdellovibrionales bacterium]
MSDDFLLHERLAADSAFVCKLGLCQLRLQNVRAVPWLILVPRRAEVSEIHQLGAADRGALMDEIVLASRVLDVLFKPDKINVGALGNIVPQLHIHVIARFKSDPAWPAPVWGRVDPTPYAAEELAALAARVKEATSKI